MYKTITLGDFGPIQVLSEREKQLSVFLDYQNT